MSPVTAAWSKCAGRETVPGQHDGEPRQGEADPDLVEPEFEGAVGTDPRVGRHEEEGAGREGVAGAGDDDRGREGEDALRESRSEPAARSRRRRAGPGITSGRTRPRSSRAPLQENDRPITSAWSKASWRARKHRNGEHVDLAVVHRDGADQVGAAVGDELGMALPGWSRRYVIPVFRNTVSKKPDPSSRAEPVGPADAPHEAAHPGAPGPGTVGRVDLLAEEGAAGLTARSLAARAETSAPALYELFGDKAGVVRELYFEGFRRLLARSGGTGRDGRPDGRSVGARHDVPPFRPRQP